MRWLQLSIPVIAILVFVQPGHAVTKATFSGSTSDTDIRLNSPGVATFGTISYNACSFETGPNYTEFDMSNAIWHFDTGFFYPILGSVNSVSTVTWDLVEPMPEFDITGLPMLHTPRVALSLAIYSWDWSQWYIGVDLTTLPNGNSCVVYWENVAPNYQWWQTRAKSFKANLNRTTVEFYYHDGTDYVLTHVVDLTNLPNVNGLGGTPPGNVTDLHAHVVMVGASLTPRDSGKVWEWDQIEWSSPNNYLPNVNQTVPPCNSGAEGEGEEPINPADVNLDGRLDAVDVQLVINEVLHIATGCDCDIDGNGLINAADLQLVINAALQV